MKISHLLIICVLQCTFLAFGQNSSLNQNAIKQELNFHLLDISSGLSHNYINDIQEDSLGFIWIATYDGLNRYDGQSFKHFKNQFKRDDLNAGEEIGTYEGLNRYGIKNNKVQKPQIGESYNGISNNYIQDIEISSDSLLIATDAGLNFLNLRKSQITSFDVENGLYSNKVSKIINGPENYVVIGTYGGGIQFLDARGNLNNLQEFLKTPDRLSSNDISSILIQGEETMWVGTFNNGLNKINLLNGSITTFHPESESPLVSSVVNSLYEDQFHNLWIGTRNGLQVISKSGDNLNFEFSNGISRQIQEEDILSFQEDGLGNLWIGTRNGGLYIVRFDMPLKKGQNIDVKHFPPRSDGLSVFNRTVSVIFRDSHGNMWLGTPTGLNFVNPNGEKIRLLKKNINDEYSLSHNRIGSVALASKNRVWVGTDGGGLDLLNPKIGVVDHFESKDGDPRTLSNNYILSIYEEKPNRVWIGTYRGGLNLLNPETGYCKHYLEGSTDNGSDVRKIFHAKNGIIWVGTNRGGLFKYLPESDRFQYIETLGKIDIRDIAEDGNGNLWLATFNSGLIRFQPKDDLFTSFNQSNLNGINSDVIFSVLILENGEILAGSRYAGLLRFDPKSNTVLSLTEEDGLSNNTVNSLVQVDSSFVWMGTYNGLNRYNIKTDEILNISSLNNIQEGEFNIGAATKNIDGVLFFGGNNGLNVFDSNDFQVHETPYPIRFKGLKVLNKEVGVSDSQKGAILNETLFFQDAITLKHNQNTFTIDYVAIKYPESKNFSYSYKLQNFNDFWVENQSSGSANFTGVPPGEYSFMVKTDTAFGEQNSKVLNITVVPPFWKTIPAYILYAILLSLSIWVGAKYYSERIKLKNSLLLEKNQRALEHDLNQERFRFFTAFSHELKTPLTLILAPVENLISRDLNKEFKKELKFIERNAKSLYKSIDTLLKFRKAEEGLSRANLEPHDLPSRLRRWVKGYVPLAKEKNINLEYIGPVESKIFNVDIEKIEVIINNLLSNAIKYCNSGDEIRVIFNTKEDGFEIKVRDTGPGIQEEELLHIFEWYYRTQRSISKSGTGIGLALSKSFAELHAGKLEVESKYKEGTTFTLKIPIKEMEYPSSELIEKDELVELEEQSKQNIYDVIKFDSEYSNITSEQNRQLILIIDDNEEILSFLGGIFKNEFDVIHAINGEEGVVKAKKYIPDLIISDLMMPEKSGFDLCSDLKGNFATSHIPIILLTADTDIESINIGYEEGADDYITKPFNIKLLKTRVKNLLDSREVLRKLFGANPTLEQEDLPVQTVFINKEKGFLKKLDKIILENLGENTNVELIASEIGMSRTSLYRKLKAITNNSINEYIRNVKVERAAELIKNDNFTVSQACYEVGFNDTKYFRKIFKERFGQNPSDFKDT